jgi:hypothetical protein
VTLSPALWLRTSFLIILAILSLSLGLRDSQAADDSPLPNDETPSQGKAAAVAAVAAAVVIHRMGETLYVEVHAYAQALTGNDPIGASPKEQREDALAAQKRLMSAPPVRVDPAGKCRAGGADPLPIKAKGTQSHTPSPIAIEALWILECINPEKAKYLDITLFQMFRNLQIVSVVIYDQASVIAGPAITNLRRSKNRVQF